MSLTQVQCSRPLHHKSSLLSELISTHKQQAANYVTKSPLYKEINCQFKSIYDKFVTSQTPYYFVRVLNNYRRMNLFYVEPFLVQPRGSKQDHLIHHSINTFTMAPCKLQQQKHIEKVQVRFSQMRLRMICCLFPAVIFVLVF